MADTEKQKPAIEAAPATATLPPSKYDVLKDAIRDYGAAAFENLLKCKALGEATVAGFAPHIGAPAGCVSGVPAEGEFDPRKDYGDGAFSFSQRSVIVLEPVRFGVSLIVGNVEDRGALWLRTVVAAELTGGAFDVFVASQPKMRIPLDFDGKLAPIYDALHQEFLDTFEIEVMEFNDARFRTGIGFLPK
jgi:hypothetical protein